MMPARLEREVCVQNGIDLSIANSGRWAADYRLSGGLGC